MNAEDIKQRKFGIVPIKISKYSYLGLDDGLVPELQKEYDNSMSSVPPTPLVGDSKDYRYPELILGRYSGSPTQMFSINNSLLQCISDLQASKEDFVSEDDLMNLAIENLDSTVRPEFSSDAINDLNQLYFSSKDAFSVEVGLSQLLSNNKPINLAISKLIDHGFPLDREIIRVKELACGTRKNRWNSIGQSIGHRELGITLTDFHEAIELPNEVIVPNIRIHHEVCNFLDSYPVLDEENKFDLMLTTYGFDSVWQEEDVRYIKYRGQWYRGLFRLKVLDWSNRKEELIQSLKTLTPYEGMDVLDLAGVFIEEAVEKIDDMSSEPFGSYIEEACKDFLRVKVNFPGGLIRNVVDAFNKQLTEGGVFLIGDVAVFEKEERDNALRAYGLSGEIAHYKVEDYLLAKEILESEYNFKVEIFSLHEFVNTYLGSDWEESFDETEVKNVINTKANCFMKVSKGVDLNISDISPDCHVQVYMSLE